MEHDIYSIYVYMYIHTYSHEKNKGHAIEFYGFMCQDIKITWSLAGLKIW